MPREKEITVASDQEVEQAAKLLVEAEYTIALTGAGMSVESGIPPFRGPGGLWTKYGEPPMNGFQIFLADPKKAWEERLARQDDELFAPLRTAKPNPGHFALSELEAMGLLRFVITQNVDDLHRQAGQVALGEIHGNFKLIRCLECGERFKWDEVDLEELPPHCPRCQGLLKSDTVSFGEPIPADVLAECFAESERCDCMLVAGTSATVYPAAQFPLDVRERGGALIEVNPYDTELTPHCTVSLRGPSGLVLPQLVTRIMRQRGQ